MPGPGSAGVSRVSAHVLVSTVTGRHLRRDAPAVDEPSLPLDVKMSVLPVRDLFPVKGAPPVFACPSTYQVIPFIVIMPGPDGRKGRFLEEKERKMDNFGP